MNILKRHHQLIGICVSIQILLGGCGAGRGQNGSSLYSDEVRSNELDNLPFEVACEHIVNATAYQGQPIQKQIAKDTIDALWDRYRKMNQNVAANVNVAGCNSMKSAWAGRKLAVSGLKRISVMLIVKLVGVAELGLTNNGMDDKDFAFVSTSGSSTWTNNLKENLEGLDVSGNEITGEAPAGFDFKNSYSRLAKFDVSKNKLKNISTLRLPYEFIDLNLANNPLSIDSFTGWDTVEKFTRLNLSGIDSLNLRTLYKQGAKKIALLDLSHVKVNATGGDCDQSAGMQNLIYANLNGAILSEDAAADLLKKSCFSSLSGLTPPTGNIGAELSTLYNDAQPNVSATCSTAISRDYSEKGRLTDIGCSGQLTFEYLNLDSNDVKVKVPVGVPNFRAS